MSNERIVPIRDNNLDLDTRVDYLLKQLTLEEKFKLSHGKNFALLNSIKRLGITSLGTTDGPHGVGPHGTGGKRNTFFSCGILMGATWNPSLLEEFGAAVAQEARACNRHVQLGPGMNIMRSPLCGRTFEYLSEDPFLAKKLAPATIRGIQSQRVAACAKHFACNNSETRRIRMSSEVSERALQEIYLPAFEASIKDGGAWTVMSSYNRINGVYASESKDLMTTRLRDQWGFKGCVISDWNATAPTKGAGACVNAGISVDMPGKNPLGKMTPGKMSKAFKAGDFTEETLNENIRRLLRVMFLIGMFDDPASLPKGARNTAGHQALARKIAGEGMVLLKNDNALLPLDTSRIKTLAVIGPNANKNTARLSILGIANILAGGGSSHVMPPYEITPLRGIKEKCKGKVKIVNDAAGADAAVVIVGLNHMLGNDSEGADRKKLELPEKHVALIKETVTKNPATIVVLVNGSPVTMDGWIDKVPAVLESWYGGMEAGHVIADILFGDVNPSGKLPITFPKKLEDSPAHASRRTFPGDFKTNKIYYDEGVFVGYRHFDTRNIEPLFPFGYGLSYVPFQYDNFSLSTNTLAGDEKIAIMFDITNTGERSGAEVAQLYMQDVESTVPRPLKELKGFKKAFLDPGHQETIVFELGRNDLAFFDDGKNEWIAEPGEFKILIGSSSRDIRLKDAFEYT